MLEFNDLLVKAGIEAKEVLLMRHKPTEPALRRVLPWYAVERPELFNGYQSAQGAENAEKALVKARYLASFIGVESGQAHFAGLYRQDGYRGITSDEYFKIPENIELHAQGMSSAGKRAPALWFDLVREETLLDFQGRLVIIWNGIERAWYQWADRNVFPIAAILEENSFTRGMPEWRELILSWTELQTLPSTWRSRLAEWRGVYLITDRTDGQQYVGSACGSENIMGRWLSYAKSGHGGNRQLLSRDPKNFDFFILQRVSPDMERDDVVSIEDSWKVRLQTRTLGLNSN